MTITKTSYGIIGGGLALLAAWFIIYIFFPTLAWALPALLIAAIYAIVVPLTVNTNFFRRYGLLIGGFGFVALWLFEFIFPHGRPARLSSYGLLAMGIIEVLLWIFKRKKTASLITDDLADTKQKVLTNVVSAVAVVIVLGGIGYFSFVRNSEPAAQQPTTNQQLEEPFTYTKNDKLFSVARKEFSVADQFSTSTLKDQSKECGTNKTEQYYKDLLSKYTGSDKGAEYRFQYQGPTQDSGAWVVTVIPNKLGYANIGDFEKDFDACYGGGDRYPSLVSDKYLLFTSSCGTGFDDDSGKPHGCDLVQAAVEPTIKLQ